MKTFIRERFTEVHETPATPHSKSGSGQLHELKIIILHPGPSQPRASSGELERWIPGRDPARAAKNYQLQQVIRKSDAADGGGEKQQRIKHVRMPADPVALAGRDP